MLLVAARGPLKATFAGLPRLVATVSPAQYPQFCANGCVKLLSTRSKSSFRNLSTGAESKSLGIVQPEVILYERGAGRNTLPRSGLAVSSMHTLYWIWYGIDFVPAINASPMTAMHIDPVLPLVGTVFASFIQLVFMCYPNWLVHKLTWQPTTKSLMVYTYSIPFIRPKTLPKVMPVGDLLLDASSPDAARIADQLGGSIGRFRGHLAIAKPGQWPPFLLDIRDESDVPEPEILLEALLKPNAMMASDDPRQRVKAGVGASFRRKENSLKKILRKRR
jgi:hypothetical protein